VPEVDLSIRSARECQVWSGYPAGGRKTKRCCRRASPCSASPECRWLCWRVKRKLRQTKRSLRPKRRLPRASARIRPRSQDFSLAPVSRPTSTCSPLPSGANFRPEQVQQLQKRVAVTRSPRRRGQETQCADFACIKSERARGCRWVDIA
jgi:hypothetical protein